MFPVLLGPIIEGFNFCKNANTLFPSDVTICIDELKPDFLQIIATSSMQAHPTVPFTFIQSKLDAFQIGFYELIKIDSFLSRYRLEGNNCEVINEQTSDGIILF